MTLPFAQTERDFGRHDVNLKTTIVDELLPEHFRDDYPSLITFLDAYYENLDSADNFGGVIDELMTIRDIEDAKLENLNFLFDELGLGISQGQFTTPREVIRNFGNFFRVKGSEYSIDGFFRAFFNETVEIFHPKDSLFYVGKSLVGTEEAKKIQDGRLFQVFSVLIKGPIPLNIWEEMYRRFVHPSGFYLGAAVVLEAEPAMNLSTLTSIPDTNPPINVTDVASMSYAAEGEAVGALSISALAPLGDGLDSDKVNPDAILYSQRGYYPVGYVSNLQPNQEEFVLRDRYSLYRRISDFNTMTIDSAERYYSSMYEFAGFHADFSDFADSATASAIRLSSTRDTFDIRRYFR
tara:strand:- start:907 stop:1959 length:1053 start_codon:yes stop_codon:yes gene_type:complete